MYICILVVRLIITIGYCCLTPIEHFGFIHDENKFTQQKSCTLKASCRTVALSSSYLKDR